MPKFKNREGLKFGKLLVLRRAENKGRRVRFVCRCDCGNIVVVNSDCLRDGMTKSCGCFKIEELKQRSTTHGKTQCKLYTMWINMKSRCYNPNNTSYSRYGARGITVCESWRQSFEHFYSWALANGFSEGLSIDRIDNDKGYSPQNCRFATHKEQMRNTSKNRLYKGKPISQWCEELGLDYGYIRRRINFYHDPVSKFFGE